MRTFEISPTEIIPLFPLPIVIFPGEAIPLHIFEERFKALVRDCLGDPIDLDNATPFGISLTEQRSMRAIGCAVQIERILRQYPDGKMDIVVAGSMRYEMQRTFNSKSYPEIQVRYFGDTPCDLDLRKRERLIAMHVRLIELVKGKPPVLSYPESTPITFILAHEAGLTVAQRQNLLETRNEDERMDFLANYYEEILPNLSERDDLQSRIKANGFLRMYPGEEIE